MRSSRTPQVLRILARAGLVIVVATFTAFILRFSIVVASGVFGGRAEWQPLFTNPVGYLALVPLALTVLPSSARLSRLLAPLGATVLVSWLVYLDVTGSTAMTVWVILLDSLVIFGFLCGVAHAFRLANDNAWRVALVWMTAVLLLAGAATVLTRGWTGEVWLWGGLAVATALLALRAGADLEHRRGEDH